MSASNIGAGNDGPYFLCIAGVRCGLKSQRGTLLTNFKLPKRYTWKDLKDLIRPQARHGIWAVYPYERTAGTGSARVKLKDEADRLYRKTHKTDCYCRFDGLSRLFDEQLRREHTFESSPVGRQQHSASIHDL